MRVELGEIEAALADLPDVRAAAVHVVEDASGARLVGYVVPRPGAATGDWRAALAPTLPDHMIPATWVVLEELPVTGSGKLDRRRLPAPRPADDAPYEAPSGPDEQAVADAWRDVLALDRVGVHDNFFAVGGDSIRSLKVVAWLRRHGYTVALDEVFLYQTVRELAARLRPADDAPSCEPGDAAFGLLSPGDLALLLKGERS